MANGEQFPRFSRPREMHSTLRGLLFGFRINVPLQHVYVLNMKSPYNLFSGAKSVPRGPDTR